MNCLVVAKVFSSKRFVIPTGAPRTGREVEGPAISSPVVTLPENGLFIPSEAEESHFLYEQPTSTQVTTPLSFRSGMKQKASQPRLHQLPLRQTAGPSTARPMRGASVGMTIYPHPDTELGTVGMTIHPHPHTELASVGMTIHPHPHTELASVGMTIQPHPHTELASVGMTMHPHPHTELAPVGMTIHPHPHTELASRDDNAFSPHFCRKRPVAF